MRILKTVIFITFISVNLYSQVPNYYCPMLNHESGYCIFHFDGNATDVKGVYDMTAYGMVSTSTVSGKFGSCYNYDGTNCYLEKAPITAIGGQATLMMSCWVYNHATSHDADYFLSVGDNSIGWDQHYLGFKDYDGTDNKLEATFRASRTSAPQYGYTAYTTAAVSKDAWHWVVAITTGLGTNINIYVDGERPAQTFLNNDGGNIKAINTAIRTSGGYNLAGYLFNGLVDDVFITDTAWSANQIKEYYLRNPR